MYENVEIPLLDEKEVSEGDVQAETDEPHPENEELGKFIGSGTLSCQIKDGNEWWLSFSKENITGIKWSLS